LFSNRHRFIIGVDEVGRGCLAGPVVAAAVILPGFEKSSEIAKRLKLLDDSKKLTAATREALSTAIRGCAQFAIGEASVEEIDTINIFHASLLAMKRAVNSLVSSAMIDLKEAVILIDGKWRLPGVEAYQLPVIKGDTKSASIAAASVIAKVHRDAFMVKLGEEFPSYNWRSNKGYGCLDHRVGLQEHGMTVWHRRSFRCLPSEDDDVFDEENEDAQSALKQAIRKVGRKNSKASSKAKPGRKVSIKTTVKAVKTTTKITTKSTIESKTKSTNRTTRKITSKNTELSVEAGSGSRNPLLLKKVNEASAKIKLKSTAATKTKTAGAKTKTAGIKTKTTSQSDSKKANSDSGSKTELQSKTRVK